MDDTLSWEILSKNDYFIKKFSDYSKNHWKDINLHKIRLSYAFKFLLNKWISLDVN